MNLFRRLLSTLCLFVLLVLPAASTTVPLTGAGGILSACVPNIVVTDIGTGSGGAVASYTITVPVGGVPSGALIVVSILDNGSSTPGGSVSDTALNTYTAATGTGAAGLGSIRIFFAFNVSALVSGNTITYTKINGASGSLGSAFYATGIKTSATPLDSGASAGATGTSTTPSVTSNAAATTGELFVGWVGLLGTPTFTQPSGWSSPPSAIAGFTLSAQGGNLINAGSTAQTYNPTLSGGAIQWLDLVTAFKNNCN